MKNVKLENGETIKLQIWDTIGQDLYRSITKSYYKGAHAIIFIFSVTNKGSFEKVKTSANQIKERAKEKTH